VAVTFEPPTASDNSGVAPTVSCDRASGSTFPIGVTTVTCTAVDGAGNAASSSFTITVSSSGGLPAVGELPETGGSPARVLALAVLLVAVGLVLTRRFRTVG
jgi:LPXTG-motif cell wall-anchored protein